MNARSQPPFPPNPSIGQKWGAWTWNGSRWVCTRLQGVFTNVQVFPASAPYTPTPGLTSLTVECWGGGGGGGFCLGDTSTTGGGGGGGSGSYSRKTLAATMVLGGVNVTIGVGGPGGNLPGSLNSQDGTPTSFGALCVANGGQGGAGNTSTNDWGSPGAGGAPGVGDIAVPGNPGFPGTSSGVTTGVTQNAAGGTGGAILGGAGMALLTPPGASNAGQPGTGPGAGGAGATVNQTATALVGGTGGNGLCVVTETCWADTGDEGDCGCGPSGGMARVAWPGGFDND